MTKREPYTDQELREMVRCIPVYPHILDDEDVWTPNKRGWMVDTQFLCFRSDCFKDWWENHTRNGQIDTLEYFPYQSGLISKEEYKFNMKERIDNNKLRLFYLEYCRDAVQGWP